MTLLIPSPQTFLTALVGVSPQPGRHVAPGQALQRLNYVTGRTLTETAIETEQAWIEARLGVAGRWLTPGIVEGLAVGVADQALEPGGLSLGSGRGVAPGGQDIAVLKPARIALDGLPELGTGDDDPRPPRDTVLALVLQPVVVEVERLPQDQSRQMAFADPCPPDATAAPFLDFVLQDAVRVGWVALPAGIGGPDPARAPNIAAEAIREIEAEAPATLPWAGLGVPVCLMAVNGDGEITWHHRAAVARRGGMLPVPEHAVGDALRQSRLEGLIEETEAASRRNGWDGRTGRDFLRHLPPAGLLPRKCWDRTDFFPSGWAIAHAPIPLSQLDAALEAAGQLAPFDLDAERDRVKFLVPVPDEHYAADLLEPITEPDFVALRAPLEARVGDTRALRNAYRAQARAVQGVLDFGSVTDFSAAEEDPIPGESGFPAQQPDPVDHDDESLAILKKLHEGLDPKIFTPDQLGMVDPGRFDGVLDPKTDRFGVTPFVTDLRALVDSANDTIDFAFNRVQAEIYRLRQIMLDNEEATKLATFPALAGLAKGTNAFAMAEGLKAHFLARDTGEVVDPDEEVKAQLFEARTMVPMMMQPVDAFGFEAFAAPTKDPREAAPQTLVVKQPKAPEIGFADLQMTTAITGFGADSASLAFGAFFADVSKAESVGATLVKDLVDNTRAGLVDDAILSDSLSKRTGILKAAPLPGDIRDVRTATIADRLKTSASVNAKASAVRLKADVLRELNGMGLSLAGLDAPLTSSRDRVLLPKGTIDRVIGATLNADDQVKFADQIAELRRPVSAAPEDGEWEVMGVTEVRNVGEGTLTLSPMGRLGEALLRQRGPLTLSILPGLTLAKELDPDPGNNGEADDESAYLSSAVATLEGTIAIIRAVEARVLAIAGAVDTAAAQVPSLSGIQTRWQTALGQADQDLDEARHDLRVAISLIAEERARLAALAEHRQKILAEKVRFVAYTRPRALKAHAAGDTLGLLLPGTFEDPLPGSLRRDVDLPEDLEAMVGALREMPIGWFSANPELAETFTRPGFLDHLFGGVRLRAAAARQRAVPSPPVLAAGAGTSVKKIRAISDGYRAMTLQLFDARARLDLTAISRESWAGRRRKALEMLSLNDLIDSGRHPSVARRAAEEVENIERVLHALWQLARCVSAPVRMLWAQTLSEFDTVGSLASLAELPGWDAVPFAHRKQMERLNTWLFGRVEADVSQAVALMSDVVRVALLLSAHAPVADIISARIDADQGAAKGAGIDITIRRGAPRIGMQVSFLQANEVRARGVVKDLQGSRARVEILDTAEPLVTLTSLHKVTLFAPSTLTRTGW